MCEEIENEDVSEETLKQPVAMSVPERPGPEEIREHEVTHIPFRSWCQACVRGRAKGQQHRRVKERVKELETLPTISVDYGFSAQLLILAPWVTTKHRFWWCMTDDREPAGPISSRRRASSTSTVFGACCETCISLGTSGSY